MQTQKTTKIDMLPTGRKTSAGYVEYRLPITISRVVGMGCVGDTLCVPQGSKPPIARCVPWGNSLAATWIGQVRENEEGEKEYDI